VYCLIGLTEFKGVAHALSIVKMVLRHDIEINPGPDNVGGGKSVFLTAVMLNCRGLGDMDKTRALLNKVYQLPTLQPLFVMLQETMITSSHYLEMAWRGQLVHTPGTGNSKGCVTLLNADNQISNIKHYGNRGHCFNVSNDMQHLCAKWI